MQMQTNKKVPLGWQGNSVLCPSAYGCAGHMTMEMCPYNVGFLDQETEMSTGPQSWAWLPGGKFSILKKLSKDENVDTILITKFDLTAFSW